MRELPELFKARMKEQLKEEYEDFLACYEREGYAGLRVNTGKISVSRFRELFPFPLEPVPWTDCGFYYKKEDTSGEAAGVTKHPYYYAGLYYIQEPSAMLPASVLPIEPGDRVLDLCAAPGGKSTHLAAKLGGKGLLVANDASASRAKALLKNLTVWGCKNSVITGETPERLQEAFGCFFDKILVDAPCSGEGMFRKDAGLIKSWEERGPKEYAALQKQILDCAVKMLRPSGMLLYSTCTFSEEEDEQVIAWILEQHEDLELIDPVIPGLWKKEADGAAPDGFARGCAPCEKAVRLWPHRICGEGHFLALLHKKGAEKTEVSEKELCSEAAETTGFASLNYSGLEQKQADLPEKNAKFGKKNRKKSGADCTKTASFHRRSEAADASEAEEFFRLLPPSLFEGHTLRQIGDQYLLVPEDIRLPGSLRYLRTGLLLGTAKKARFEPDQALAMALGASDYPQVLDLAADDPRVIRYLKGETIDLLPEETEKKKGWVLICVDGFGIGWGKYAGDSVKNKYYPGWRLQ
ncbi:MAG: RsmB/NOP family class I SAM-dependent RNA methyltransferase [Lachnospiraceae bacterium]|nr:RsmB/NOP family class I SAM-dependent RNA methyltransferase [Lachnospiraceae bacterium]